MTLSPQRRLPSSGMLEPGQPAAPGSVAGESVATEC
jgi:hypothetical protein